MAKGILSASPIFIGNRGLYFWDTDASGTNRRFLEGIDSDYYREASQLIDPDQGEEYASRHSTLVRSLYLQSSETLFSLLMSLIQANLYPAGWLLCYQTRELRKLMEQINRHNAIPVSQKPPKVGWAGILHLILDRSPELNPQEASDLAAMNGKTIGRIASDFLQPATIDEYNSIKHGLRTRRGGFELRFAPTPPDGSAIAEEDYRSLGGQKTGSSFPVTHDLEGGRKKIDRHLVHTSVNWNLESLVHRIEFMSYWIHNCISFFLASLCGVQDSKISIPPSPLTDSASRSTGGIQNMTVRNELSTEGWGDLPAIPDAKSPDHQWPTGSMIKDWLDSRKKSPGTPTQNT